MAQSLGSLYVHIIFSTKERERSIHEEMQQRLYEYMGGVSSRRKSPLIAAGGIEDHVHLLVSQARDVSVSELVRDLKSASSGWVHQTFSNMRGFAWQTGYAAFSVSKSNIPSVTAYIADQREHHRVRTFKDEYLALLKKHEVEYDERYMWE